MTKPFVPEVLRFSAVIVERDGKTSLEIPANISTKLSDMPKVEGMINGHPFRAAISLGDRGVFLRVNSAMLRGAGVVVGDKAELAILGPEPDPVPPSDLQSEFDMSPEAVENWNTLTTLGKRDWLRWINDTKNPETRARRIARTIEQLSEGKRRACCINVNGFMMCRIEEDSKENI